MESPQKRPKYLSEEKEEKYLQSQDYIFDDEIIGLLDSVEQQHQQNRTESEIHTPPIVSLEYWEVPEDVRARYRLHGVETLFKWQIECLQAPKVWQGGNLVYSAPTSGGKTLVAELLMLRMLLNFRKKALFVLPFVSVVAEKVAYLKDIFEPLHLQIEGFYANRGHRAFDAEIDIGICTIEKANSIVNRLLEEGTLGDLGVVVIDEIHMIGDRDRGYILELLITKLLYKSSASLQIIALSATLPNIEVFQKWLKASLYVTQFRPVPLMEFVKVGKTIYDKSWKSIRTLDCNSNAEADHLVALCQETTNEGGSVLVFLCHEKKLRRILSTCFPEYSRSDVLHGTEKKPVVGVEKMSSWTRPHFGEERPERCGIPSCRVDSGRTWNCRKRFQKWRNQRSHGNLDFGCRSKSSSSKSNLQNSVCGKRSVRFHKIQTNGGKSWSHWERHLWRSRDDDSSKRKEEHRKIVGI
eukprot:TRINITY_DN3226_c0_g1_i1.p1 TRINITY_DN3226_c0_g1~~TRINITY_DN3226_c0_g1_i1.p1  ORF type:complete len:467 (+),score=89.97 TRINITY_DN3226_c0_g1_i1:389-1789(+)